MGVNIVATFLIIISVLYINAEEYVILDESDFKVWDADDQNPVFEEDGAISSLCENYDLIINDQRIGCDNIQIIPKAQNGHEISKRDVAETDLEGSGNGEIPHPEIALYEAPSNKSEIIDVHPKNVSVAETPLISNLTDLNVVESDKKDTLKSNETKSEDEKLPETEVHEINTGKDGNKSNLDEDTPQSNETKSEDEKLTAAEVHEINIGKDENKVNLTDENTPQLNVTNYENKNLAETEAVEKNNENRPVNVEETKKSNGTNTVVQELRVNLKGPDTVTNTELPKSPYNNISGDENKQLENTNHTESPTRVFENTVNKSEIAVTPIIEVNATILSAQQPTMAKQEKLPVQNISSETTLAPVKITVASPINLTTTKIPEKEEGLQSNSSDIKNVDSGKEGSTRVPPRVRPSDLAEVESINNHKETEAVNEEQSGNAILLKTFKSDDAPLVEGSDTDKALQKMEENAKISNEPTDQPNAGESSKDVSKASKDTTILVVLFVVVIVIGGAAFTHNFIKKRKQNAAANNEIINGIRRSLQNLSSNNGKNSTDVEQGTELKPLMKNSPQISKDYTDTKKEVEA